MDNDVTLTDDVSVDAPVNEPTITDLELRNNSSEMSPEFQRMLRLVQVSSKFASTMALRPINAHIDEQWQCDAPAWSDSDNIWFNRRKVGDLTDPKRMTAAKGLTIHEISHILLTPRASSNISQWVRKNKFWPAFNALEDQRIETLMTAKYPAISQWLVATIANFLLEKKADYSAQFPIVWGRKYLPLDVRNATAKVFAKPENVTELGQIIDEYVTLNLADRKVITRAQELIERYHTLVMDSLTNVYDSQYAQDPERIYKKMGDPNGHIDRKNGQWKTDGGKVLDKDQQASMAKRAQAQMTGDGTPARGSDSLVDRSDAGSAMRQAIADLADQAEKSLEPELTNLAKQLNGDAGLKGGKAPAPDKPKYKYNRQPSAEAMQAVKTFSRELQAIKAEHDPGWDKHMSTGRLNVQRYSQGCDVDEAFDQWNMGREDAVDIECVILLDTSPSMNWCIDDAYESMWVVKRSMDKIGASTTVVTYDSESRLLYTANQRASLKVDVIDRGNSTEPLEALQYARQIVAESKRAMKIVVTITDGEWGSPDACDNILRNLRNNGVLTALAYVDDTDWWNERVGTQREGVKSINTHGCEVATLVNKPAQLAQFARRMVKSSIARNLERA